MPKAKVNNIEIEYETFGDPSSEPMLLIQGNSAQMTYWDKDFCNLLADRGFWVIRFDNRDTGLSTKFDDWGEVNFPAFAAALQRGEKVKVPYTIYDMAADAIGLLDVLNIDKAHIFGHSLGGFMSLCIVTQYQERVLSLIAHACHTGDPEGPKLLTELFEYRKLRPDINKDRKAFIEWRVEYSHKNYGDKFPFDKERTRKRIIKALERNYSPNTTARHTMALRMGGNVKPGLKNVKIPTLVLQGTEDVIVPVEGSRDVANSIEGSEFLLIEGMGHNLHPQVWDQVIDAIAKTIRRAQK